MKLTIILLFAIVAVAYQVSAQKKDKPTTTQPKTTASPGKAGKKDDKATKNDSKTPKKDEKPAKDDGKAAKKGDKAANKEDNGNRKHKNAQMGPHKVYHNCFCDNVVGKSDLDLKSFAGTWYVRNQQSALSFYPFTGDCAYGNVTYVDDKALKLSTSSNFHVSKIQAIDTKLSYVGKGVFNWELGSLSIDNNTVPVNSTLKFAVVDVDYKNYTVLYICGNYTLGGVAPQAAAAAAPNNADDPYVPPSAFVLLSRARITKYKMKDFNKTISSMYDCYHHMHTPTKQDAETCKTSF